MGEVFAFSQSSLLLLPHSPLHTSTRVCLLSNCSQPSLAVRSPMRFSSTRPIMSPISHAKGNWSPAGAVSGSTVPTTFTVDSGGEGIDILQDSGGSDDNFSGGSGGGGGGGGGNGGNDDNTESGNEDESGGHEKKTGMSMSQKLTLGYAALVGIGGAMGYLKGGSKKSLIAGGFSASILYYVYTLLPSNPVFASSIGLILSATLLGVMGSRFKKSGKIFPAGVVSLTSLVMTGGYLHGIMRSSH